MTRNSKLALVGALVHACLAQPTRLSLRRDVGKTGATLTGIALSLENARVISRKPEVFRSAHQVDALRVLPAGVESLMLALVDGQTAAVGKARVAGGAAALVGAVDEHAHFGFALVAAHRVADLALRRVGHKRYKRTMRGILDIRHGALTSDADASRVQ